MAFKLNIGLLALSLSLSLVNLEGASAGMATRYYDCCKPSASWNNKAPVYAPVDVCKADGVTLIDPAKAESGQSGCNGGDQFMCTCMQPFDDQADATLAFGFAAFSTGRESETDCACFVAEFSGDEQGKPMKRNKLIFQVTNTGGDVKSENIDFQIPGGGLGAFTQGCPAQWKTPAEQWGETFGGVKTADECSGLPEPLQAGCRWRFTSWGNNPQLKGEPQRVRCPKSLIDRSGCQRKDDNTVGAYKGKVASGNEAAPAQYKRNRSVCSAVGSGSEKEGYSPDTPGSSSSSGSGPSSGTDTTQNPPEEDAGGSMPPIENNAGSPPPADGGAGTVPPQQGSAGSPAPDASSGGAGAPEGYSPESPSAPKGHKGHKMHKVCKKWH